MSLVLDFLEPFTVSYQQNVSLKQCLSNGINLAELFCTHNDTEPGCVYNYVYNMNTHAMTKK